MKKTISTLLLFTVMIPSSLCAKEMSRAQYLMGTICEITAEHPSKSHLNSALSKAFQIISDLDKKLSHFKKTSEISQLNHSGVKRPHVVSKSTFDIMLLSYDYWKKTNGYFDVTLSNKMEYVEFNKENQSIFFKDKNIHIDLGGIGKGYALDKALAVLEQEGIKRARLNFGGQILVKAPMNNPWIILLSHPSQPQVFIQEFKFSEGSFSTSDQNQKHIRDPHSGQFISSNNGLTVIAKNGAEADALSTALFAMGIEKGLEWAEKSNLCVVTANPKKITTACTRDPSLKL